MRFTILLLALASAFTLAATNAAAAPRPVASQKPQTAASLKPQATTLGTESITIPQMLSYQGKLTDTLGAPVPDTTYQVTFRLYTVATGGASFWNETQTVRTRTGLFSTLVGSVAPIESVPAAGSLYLGMAVAGGSELSPRLQLVGSAYSYLAGKSANSDLLQGKDTTGFVQTGQANSVTGTMIVDGTISSADLGDTTVGTAKLKPASVTAPKLNQMGAATGQVMKWTGSAWAPRNDSVGSGGTGTVTSVRQATGIVCSPNPITDSGTVRLDTMYTDGRYIKNQNANGQTGNFYITGAGQAAQFHGVSTTASSGAIHGEGGTYAYGVRGTSTDSAGVSGISTNVYGVYGTSTNGTGVFGTSTNGDGVEGQSSTDNYPGVYGYSTVTGTGEGTGVYGESRSFWGVQGWRDYSQRGIDYGESDTRGGVQGYTLYGDTYAFGTAGYTGGDYARTGGVIGAEYNASTWGSLGYKNSSGNWYAGYGTSGWTSGSGLSSHPATGIGCGYGGGLMGGWLKGKYYGATVSGDRYALYTKGNSYTSGYSAVMQNTGTKREAAYVATSMNVDIYMSGVSEMKGGQTSVTFPASFAAMVSKDVPVVVTATPMGPTPIYLSSSDNNGFTVAAVDAKMTGSVKFSWIAVGRRAGYETDPEVPAELTKTDFDSKMDGVMSNENDLEHPAQPVWFDGTQLRFDAPPQEPLPPKPAQPAFIHQNPTPTTPVGVVPSSGARKTTGATKSGATASTWKLGQTQTSGTEP